MKKLFFAALITPVLILTTNLSYGQAAGNAVYSDPGKFANRSGSPLGGADLTLNQYSYSFSNAIEANVMINYKATAYVAIFSLTQYGKTIEETEAALKNRINIFTSKLQKESIGEKQVFIDPVSLVPTYEVQVTEKKYSKTMNEVPAGYEIRKNVHITFIDQRQINEIISIAAQAEVYDLVKVEYSVPDLDNILDQLRQDALKILLAKKDIYEKAGIHIRISRLGEKYGSVFPAERYAQYYAYKTSEPPVTYAVYKKGTPQQQVQYNAAEKNKTVYYEKISDKQFDKVINATVSEPVVQIYLSLKSEYIVYDPEKEAIDKAYNEQQRINTLKEMELRIEEKKKDIQLKTRNGVK